MSVSKFQFFDINEMKRYFHCISVFMVMCLFYCVPAYEIQISGIRAVCFFSILLCMSQMRSGYKELGLDLVEPLQDQPRKPRWMPMGDEKKDEGAGDPIKIFLEEALEKKRNAMMDNFSQILQRLPIGGANASNSHSGGTTPLKVQVNFDIPVFEGQIDADAIDKLLNLLEGYF